MIEDVRAREQKRRAACAMKAVRSGGEQALLSVQQHFEGLGQPSIGVRGPLVCEIADQPKLPDGQRPLPILSFHIVPTLCGISRQTSAKAVIQFKLPMKARVGEDAWTSVANVTQRHIDRDAIAPHQVGCNYSGTATDTGLTVDQHNVVFSSLSDGR